MQNLNEKITIRLTKVGAKLFAEALNLRISDAIDSRDRLALLKTQGGHTVPEKLIDETVAGINENIAAFRELRNDLLAWCRLSNAVCANTQWVLTKLQIISLSDSLITVRESNPDGAEYGWSENLLSYLNQVAKLPKV